MQLLASGPSADVFRLADGKHVVAFAPPLYVSTAGVVYLDTSQLGEHIRCKLKLVKAVLICDWF